MEWLPIAVIVILIIILGLYSVVKRAVKVALREYFKDNLNEQKDNKNPE